MEENLNILNYKVYKNDKIISVNTIPMNCIDWVTDSFLLSENKDIHILFEGENCTFDIKITEYRK